MLRLSVFSERRNFRRAGRLWKSERTSTCVPGASPPSRTVSSLPPLTIISVPATASVSRVLRRNPTRWRYLATLRHEIPAWRPLEDQQQTGFYWSHVAPAKAAHHHDPFHSRHRSRELVKFLPGE